jgi:addiction module RelE/StbE family toxin
MRTLLWSKTFVKAFKQTLKRHPTLRPDLEATLRLLAEDPFAPSLATHKLKGKLSGLWACRVGYDMRIIFEFIRGDNSSADDIFLLGLGTHDEVYY